MKALAAVVGLLLLPAPAAAQQVVDLQGVATKPGEYLYLPFEVPEGVNRIDVTAARGGPTAARPASG